MTASAPGRTSGAHGNARRLLDLCKGARRSADRHGVEWAVRRLRAGDARGPRGAGRSGLRAGPTDRQCVPALPAAVAGASVRASPRRAEGYAVANGGGDDAMPDVSAREEVPAVSAARSTAQADSVGSFGVRRSFPRGSRTLQHARPRAAELERHHRNGRFVCGHPQRLHALGALARQETPLARVIEPSRAI